MENVNVTYNAKQYCFERGIITHKIPAIIKRETAKCYLIELQKPGINGQRRGDQIMVRKSSVVFQNQPRPQIDYTNAWWNN